jgi:D-3-phosphoglycerate dehydrogenase / 2-oxoglutarate reductase
MFMRVLFADSNHPVLHELLLKAGFECDLFWDKNTKELLDILPHYDALVLRSKFKITKDILNASPRLSCIARVGAGLENIDVNYATLKGIRCLSVPEGNRDALGEHALGMLLMLLNKLKKADAEVRQGVWLRAENRGYEIKGKTIAIIGYGNMGSSFAKKLSGFDCKIIAYDKYRTNFASEQVEEVTLETIYKEADIVSLHVPLTEETHYLVNTEFLEKFTKPIYLINTARGKCLNTEALVNAIKAETVKGACLDVLEYESVSFEQVDLTKLPEPMHYLIKSDKVILSPHIAGWTHESNYRMSELIALKMIDVLTTKK